jgi:hypothetical protein
LGIQNTLEGIFNKDGKSLKSQAPPTKGVSSQPYKGGGGGDPNPPLINEICLLALKRVREQGKEIRNGKFSSHRKGFNPTDLGEKNEGARSSPRPSTHMEKNQWHGN